MLWRWGREEGETQDVSSGAQRFVDTAVKGRGRLKCWKGWIFIYIKVCIFVNLGLWGGNEVHGSREKRFGLYFEQKRRKGWLEEGLICGCGISQFYICNL